MRVKYTFLLAGVEMKAYGDQAVAIQVTQFCKSREGPSRKPYRLHALMYKLASQMSPDSFSSYHNV